MKKLFLLFISTSIIVLAACDRPMLEGTWNLSIGSAEDRSYTVDSTDTEDGGVVLLPMYSNKFLKIDSDGKLLWEKVISFGDGWLDVIKETDDKGFILGGDTRDMDKKEQCKDVYMFDYACQRDVGIIKTDQAGNEIWRNYYGRSDVNEDLENITQTKDGGYLIVYKIYTRPPDSDYTGPDYEFMIHRLDENGETLFEKPIFFDQNVKASNIKIYETDNKNIIVAGNWHQRDYDIFVMMLDSTGEKIWQRRLGDGPHENDHSALITNEFINCFNMTANGQSVVVYSSRKLAGNYPAGVTIVRLDADGQEVWKKNIFDTVELDSRFSSIEETRDSGFILTGYYTENYVSAEDLDLILLKLDPNGDTVWRRLYGGVNDDHGKGAYELATGGFMVTGTTESFLPGGIGSENDDAKTVPNHWVIRTNEKGNASPLPDNLSMSDIGLRNLIKILR